MAKKKLDTRTNIGDEKASLKKDRTRRPPKVNPKKPRPVVNPKKPKPIVVPKDPKPVVIPKKPRPVVNPKKPKPVVTPKDPKPTSKFSFNKESVIQSNQIYIQAAGSLGVDSSAGKHLRWFFRDKLGASHLPKGNYTKAQHGYNKTNDFVHVYKIPYRNTSSLLSFMTNPASISHELYSWMYDGTKTNKTAKPRRYIVKFLDKDIYDQVRTEIGYNPSATFLWHYSERGGVIEIQIKNGLCFGVKLRRLRSRNGELKIETFSVDWSEGSKEAFISSRLILPTGSGQILGENISYLRLAIGNNPLEEIDFEYYEDFLSNNAKNAKKLGEYALTIDEPTAFKRLENLSQFRVDGLWEKYNDGATVLVDSYKAKWRGWTDDDNLDRRGITYGVEQYLTLSNDINNPTAKAVLTEDSTSSNGNNASTTVVEYLNLLHIISSDYHVARMCGFGSIDSDNDDEKDQYVYLMEYHISHGKEGKELSQHLYMTLPTSHRDERPTMKIRTLPIQYGLDNPNTSRVCDEDGYTPDGVSRFIRVYNKLLHNYSESNDFFNPSLEFSLSTMTHPVFAGIEYKKENEANWRDPEIAHQNILGNLEPLPLLFFEDAQKPSLLHQEQEEGVHEYASYGINIFSRSGEISNRVKTDYTKFTIPNRLLPPSNLKVQLIQQELPLLLTSQTEQDALASLSANNPNSLLLRVVFDYHHEHDINYQFANKIEFLFRKEKQRVVKGKAIATGIQGVLDSDTYVMNQANISNEIPDLPAGFGGNFINGRLSVNGSQYAVGGILQEGVNPRIQILPNVVSELVNDGNGNMSTVDTASYPATHPNDSLLIHPENLFMLEENLDNVNNWGNTVFGFKLRIEFPGALVHSESYTDQQGVVKNRDLRGFWEDAKFFQHHDLGNNPVQGTYRLEFSNFQLPPHPQAIPIQPQLPSVSFFGGVVRVHENGNVNGNRKTLKVLGEVDNSTSLILLVKDETFNPNIPSSGLNIATGISVSVNYYPGYKVYLQEDSTAEFTMANVVPSNQFEYERQTIFTAVATAQDPNSNDINAIIKSKTSGAKIISSEKIIAPQIPQAVLGPLYATLPDLYSKSTYTFSFANGNPYALIFYRTNLNAVLNALYELATVQEIQDALLHPYDDPNFTTRWQGLVNADLSSFYSNTGAIDGNKFPFPNKLIGTSNQFGTFASPNFPNIQKAIENTSFPVLEEPLLFEKIVLDRMSPEHPAMIDGSNNTIRFTDYSLDGAKVDSYFYFVKEMGSRYDLGQASKLIGPVQMINTRPPSIPVIRKIISQEHSLRKETEAKVILQIMGFKSIDRIRKIKLYRSTDELDALSVRTMTMVKEVDIDDAQPISDPVFVEDDFLNDSEVPFGDKLYYKVVVCRHIKYIKDNVGALIDDYVPSIPSKTLSTIVVDSTNPEPPTLSIDELVMNTSEDEITSLKLSWNKTTYKGKYTLSKMNSKGNWHSETVVESNDDSELFYELPAPIPKLNEDGNPIYHRFRVDVLSTTGLGNIVHFPVTI